ncbi:uncharacterized protein [Argopecten irradians]|uniref:uncharacterized protein isoform X2 n=1 Tax=Argopecten irradians TaxID=31199 RepID=UPI003711C785
MYRTYYTLLLQLGSLVALIDGRIRLMDGINEFQGRLEIYDEGRWGTVCDSGWESYPENVVVVCRQLGFEPGRYTKTFRRRNKTFRIDKVICDGSEERLGACQYDVLSNRNCEGRKDYEVNVMCNRPTEQVVKAKLGDIRLKNGRNDFEGRVEIFLENKWLSICQNGWAMLDAQVACRQLGFNGGIPKYNSFFGNGYGDPWRVALACDRSNDRLIECKTPTAACSRSDTSGVICEPPKSYGSECEAGEQCAGNSVCVLSEGKQLCQCSDEDMMFWDNELSTCKTKLQYNQTCNPNVSHSCVSDLLCSGRNNSASCQCYNPDEMFWDFSSSTCRSKSHYNDNCTHGVSTSCRSNLVCAHQSDSSSLCRCHDEETTFWDDSTFTCNRIDKFSAVFIQLQLPYDEAVSYCVSEVNGSLATLTYLEMLFQNCTDYMPGVWLQTEIQRNTTPTCRLSDGTFVYNNSCTDDMHFVCIKDRNHVDDAYCTDFPTRARVSESVSAPPSAVIWTVIVLVCLLVVAVFIISVVIYRRKQIWKANNTSSNPGLHTFLNNTYDTNMPFNENPYMEINNMNEPNYANVSVNVGTSSEKQQYVALEGAIKEEKQVKTHKGNQYTMVDSKSSGYLDMSGKLPASPTKSKGEICNNNTYDTVVQNPYLLCNPSTGKDESHDGGYTLCSRPETHPGVYNTFADMKQASTEHATENPYDNMPTEVDGGYSCLNTHKNTETDNDISGYIDSSDFQI